MNTLRLFSMTLALSLAAFTACTANPEKTSPKPEPVAPVKVAKKPAEKPIKNVNSAFIELPYLQIGATPKAGSPDSLTVLWHTEDKDADWKVEMRPVGSEEWNAVDAPTMHRISVPTIEPHRVYQAVLSSLPAGKQIEYRLLKGGEAVFGAKAKAPVAAGDPYRFVVFGDCSENTPGQKGVAYQTYQQKPDFVFITGDIVYSDGRISEYREKYFPIYNADEADPKTGAPLIRSTLFLSTPGNHDIAHRDLAKVPDGLAYFHYWSQPLNGPLSTPGAPNTPKLSGPQENQEAFMKSAGDSYPRMANYSFDYAGAHWTVLDANPYVNWSNAELRAWVEQDLAKAQGAAWRFVAFHQPGFNSSRKHFTEQQMRQLADVFENGKVDIVFSGHVHNYQRTYPLRFKADKVEDGAKGLTVGGKWTLDKAFDGVKNTKADGVLYIITGAGGASLYNPEQEPNPSSWQEFTVKYKAKYSCTVVDVKGNTLKLRQVAGDGQELDSITLTK